MKELQSLTENVLMAQQKINRRLCKCIVLGNSAKANNNFLNGIGSNYV